LKIERTGEEESKRQMRRLATKEADYLRLRRARLGADDFTTVKVIGKGAFGEVSHPFISVPILSIVNNVIILFWCGWYKKMILEKFMP
jgi:hypothetical protein